MTFIVLQILNDAAIGLLRHRAPKVKLRRKSETQICADALRCVSLECRFTSNSYVLGLWVGPLHIEAMVTSQAGVKGRQSARLRHHLAVLPTMAVPEAQSECLGHREHHENQQAKIHPPSCRNGSNAKSISLPQRTTISATAVIP
jgi:hypothetical protein